MANHDRAMNPATVLVYEKHRPPARQALAEAHVAFELRGLDLFVCVKNRVTGVTGQEFNSNELMAIRKFLNRPEDHNVGN